MSLNTIGSVDTRAARVVGLGRAWKRERAREPLRGDVQANRRPRLYVTLAKVLKPIQIKNHYPFHFGGKGRRMNHAITNAWLRRFDDK